VRIESRLSDALNDVLNLLLGCIVGHVHNHGDHLSWLKAVCSKNKAAIFIAASVGSFELFLTGYLALIQHLRRA
jgi:hypothetical protein